ncbi:hypothetical protein QT972_32175 [Microcoleus sp. herbarium7]|uniref:hypothetical protein n=1 Tax=Microcoleus sp. herbarium7 TaxID=3055435 RepID=UPI002FD3E8C8
MTPEDKKTAQKLLNKIDQWIEETNNFDRLGFVEGIYDFCFARRRDLDFKNNVATEEDIAKILDLGERTHDFHSDWRRLSESLESLKSKLNAIIED